MTTLCSDDGTSKLSSHSRRVPGCHHRSGLGQEGWQGRQAVSCVGHVSVSLIESLLQIGPWEGRQNMLRLVCSLTRCPLPSKASSTLECLRQSVCVAGMTGMMRAMLPAAVLGRVDGDMPMRVDLLVGSGKNKLAAQACSDLLPVLSKVRQQRCSLLGLSAHPHLDDCRKRTMRHSSLGWKASRS